MCLYGLRKGAIQKNISLSLSLSLLPENPAPRRVSFNIFMREKIHLRDSYTGISAIRVFITEYVEEEM